MIEEAENQMINLTEKIKEQVNIIKITSFRLNKNVMISFFLN